MTEPDARATRVLRPRLRTLGKILIGVCPVVFLVGIVGAGVQLEEFAVDGTRVAGIAALVAGMMLVLLSDPPHDRQEGPDVEDDRGEDARASR